MIKSLNHYRMMDLTLLTILAVISEIMGDLLLKRLPGAGFSISFSILITIVAIIRWGKIGSLVYVIAGIPMIILAPNSILQNILLYPVANAFIILAYLVVERMDMKNILRDILKLLLFVALTYLSVAIGKGLMIFIYGTSFFQATAMYFMANLFNVVMTYIVILLVRGRPGLLVDMKTYFMEAQTEERQWTQR